MTKRRELSRTISEPQHVPATLEWAGEKMRQGLAAGPVMVVLTRPRKSADQEAKYHAMINDIHQQCFRGYTFDAVKAVLVHQFALAMEEAGEPLANPGERVWDWKTKEPVYVRPSTTKFNKKEGAAFIEFLYAEGTEYGVTWSEKSRREAK